MPKIVEFDIITLKYCSDVEEESLSGQNCTGGTKSGWHNKLPPPPSPQTEFPLQNNVSMAKRLLTALSAKKLRNLTFTPQYRAEQFPNDLYVSGELLFCKEADLRNHN